MIDYVRTHFEHHPPNPGQSHNVRPAIRCVDGYQISVQASSIHYCSPKATITSAYTHVEVFARRKDGRMATNNPEGWVPVHKVNERIARHGGPDPIHHAWVKELHK